MKEPIELQLLEAIESRAPRVREAVARQDYRGALSSLAQLGPTVDRFFVDVLVMADDPALRTARLSLMAHLRDLVLTIADVSEIVAEG